MPAAPSDAAAGDAPDASVLLYGKPAPGVATLTLNRPAALNAINLAMRDELWGYLDAVAVDPDVRVLLFRGAGPRAFSAGADITEFGSAPSLLAARDARQQRDIWDRLERLPVLTIAALHGFCFGAGIELPLYCDLRIAADDTRIALPEVTLGYIPSAGGTQMLPRLMPPGVARGFVLSGDAIDAGPRPGLGPGARRRPPRRSRRARPASRDAAGLARHRHADRRRARDPARPRPGAARRHRRRRGDGPRRLTCSAQPCGLGRLDRGARSRYAGLRAPGMRRGRLTGAA